ncbi:mechanosensitive ion channel family protein [Pseudonocardia spinosispora]|uniref:mechanosensitive ion channel family protein n=1 Tax=Pseudonocardia spinosispora TaxID=103441 RepID=UPI0004125BB2|nr:mechanosensitive ion channel family protein [Pseudonocardia spinosispora]
MTEWASDIFSTTPACVRDQGSWCARVYGWTHNDVLSRSADVLVDRALDILLIVVLALVARALLHRAIRRVVRGATNGQVRIPSALRRRAPSGLKDIAAPLVSERRVQRANTVGSVLRSLTSAVVLVVASIMVMAEFGLNLAPVLASAGIVGVAIGFGAQNLVRDFLSGMFMMLEDQYGVGDVVDLGEASGTVEAVGLRITTLRDVRGTVWHVRNGAIQRVGNKSQGYAVAVVDVPLGYQANITEASEIAGRVADEVAARDDVAPVMLEPPQVLGVEAVSIEGVTLRLTAKVQPGEQFAVQRALNAAINTAFDKAGLPRPVTNPTSSPNKSPSNSRSQT